jgi:hypothetical protein
MRVAQELVFHENGPNGYPLDFVPLNIALRPVALTGRYL